MARRRMYIFERAYGDYAARFRTAGRWFAAQSAAVWNWLWSGPGAHFMEVALQATVVASGIVLGAMYVSYESRHGRGFGAGTFFTFCFIAAYVSILLWGWKTPVHFTARLVSGAVGAGLVILLGALLLGPAGAVFLFYLLALVTLTALSFLVFLPMRGLHSLWMLQRRIAYHCPNDDCPSKGLPIHLCPTCGERYPDLLPSFYGIFYHTCRHPEGDVQLPTMEFWGRGRLPRLCAGCERQLIHSSIGDLEVRPIAVVGGVSVGKTVFLAQATRQLREEIGRLPGASARVDSATQQREHERQIAQLEKGRKLDKTVGDSMEALGVALRVPSRKLRCLLYLFDAPGEKFATMQSFGKMQIIQELRGITLLVDPFSLPQLEGYRRQLGSELSPSEDKFGTIVDNLINVVNMMGLCQTDQACDVPLAVVVSKMDALPAAEHSYLADLCAPEGHADGEVFHDRCRNALYQLGAWPSMHKLEQKFSRLRYFACSALGRLPETGRTDAFRPVGVVAPFVWLLGLDGKPVPPRN